MDFDPYFAYIFVYYTVMTGSEDQRLDLSIWIDIHTHTHTHTYIYFVGLFTNVFNASVVYFYVKHVKCQSKI